MSIQLSKPYKIIPSKHKRYDAHYQIKSTEAIVIPTRILGNEVLCDIRWEDQEGVIQVRRNAMFASDNLIPINDMVDNKLSEIWMHYYGNEEKALAEKADAAQTPERHL